jgi:hypothetical protein
LLTADALLLMASITMTASVIWPFNKALGNWAEKSKGLPFSSWFVATRLWGPATVGVAESVMVVELLTDRMVVFGGIPVPVTI